MSYKKIHLLLLTFLLTSFAKAQSVETPIIDLFSNNELQVRQKPHSEQILASMLSGLKTRTDTLYAVIYYPNTCRRCEALMNNFDANIKKVSPTAETVLISVYPNAELAEYYHKREGYHFDFYAYDTNELYTKTLSFNLNSMNSSFVLKIRKSTGELLLGGNMAEEEDVRFTQLVEFDGMMPQYDFQTGASTDIEKIHIDYPSLDEKMFDEYIVGHPLHPISTVLENPVFVNGLFCYNDQLEEGVYVFQENGDSLSFFTEIKVNEEEKYQFIEIDSQIFREMQRSNSLYFMPLAPFIPNGCNDICVSYSLPNIFSQTEIVNGDTITENVYANKAVIIRRDYKSFLPLPMLPINIDLENMEYFYSHFAPCIIGDNIIMGCKKITWPMDVPTEYYQGQGTLDPFLPVFYDNAPVFAVFDKITGLVKGHYGNLDSFSRKTRTGYVYNSSVFAVSSDQLACCNRYGGSICVYDTIDFAQPVESYQFFAIDTTGVTLDESKFYSKEYRFCYDKLFYQTVEQISLTKSHIYGLICYGTHSKPDMQNDLYVYISINRNTGEILRRIIPHIEGAEILGYGLKESNDHVQPFVFYRTNMQTKVRVYRQF